ncbi:MAG TPA: ComF family protein [Usitatibacter sp.]|nr:ComF family protein [Usitatibacter sp.]
MSSWIDGSPLRLPGFSSLAAALFAQDCALCLASAGRDLVCGPCRESLPWLRASCSRCALPLAHDGVCGGCRAHAPHFDETVCALEYRFPVDRLVQRFKYSGDFALGRWLALQLAHRVRARPDLIAPAPLAPARLRQRGFNQAAHLARVAGHRLGVRVEWRGFERTRETQPQQGLDRRARRANVRGAFRCRLPLEGLHVAVVDDVVTTGATADALAQALRAAGAARVSVWAVARTPDPA